MTDWCSTIGWCTSERPHLPGTHRAGRGRGAGHPDRVGTGSTPPGSRRGPGRVPGPGQSAGRGQGLDRAAHLPPLGCGQPDGQVAAAVHLAPRSVLPGRVQVLLRPPNLVGSAQHRGCRDGSPSRPRPGRPADRSARRIRCGALPEHVDERRDRHVGDHLPDPGDGGPVDFLPHVAQPDGAARRGGWTGHRVRRAGTRRAGDLRRPGAPARSLRRSGALVAFPYPPRRCRPVRQHHRGSSLGRLQHGPLRPSGAHH